MSDFPYQHVGLGGTFDHFHVGHVSFLRFAAQHAPLLTIGVTVPALTAHKKFAANIEPYAVRFQSVKDFCEKNSISAQLVELHDVYGPTVTSASTIEALIVTTDTQTGASQINARRRELDLVELPVHVHQLLLDSTGQPINSTRIRAGEISRQGLAFTQLFTSDCTLTPPQRAFLRQPQGPVVTKPASNPNGLPVFVVGDVVQHTFEENHWHYDLGIFDGHTQRHAVPQKLLFQPTTQHQVINQPGTISHQLASAILDWQRQPFTHLFVQGEEDLAAVALVMLAPLGSLVYYGQPQLGMVQLVVTEELKASLRMQLWPNSESFPKP